MLAAASPNRPTVSRPRAAAASALSLWAALNSAGFALGVVIGGLLTEGVGWRWVMFVNVPVGLALMAGIASSLLAPVAPTTRPRLDVPGALTSTVGSALLVYGITQSTARGWGSPLVSGALVRDEPLGPPQLAAMLCCGGALVLSLLKPAAREPA